MYTRRFSSRLSIVTLIEQVFNRLLVFFRAVEGEKRKTGKKHDEPLDTDGESIAALAGEASRSTSDHQRCRKTSKTRQRHGIERPILTTLACYALHVG